jgi:hypothetical protein
MSAPAKVAVVLWLIVGGLILFMGYNAPHSKPSLEFLIPRSDPLTWIIPAILAGPPLLLAIARSAPPKLSTAINWALAIVLGLAVGAMFALPIVFAIMRS